MLLKNAKVLCGDFVFRRGDILIENGIIKKVIDLEPADYNGQEILELDNYAVIPGLVDVHMHGCAGVDTMDVIKNPEVIDQMSRFLLKNGVTSFYPTSVAAAMEDIGKVFAANTKTGGADVLGFHMEGPYINPVRKGALNEKYIKNSDISEFLQFNNVKMVTIAPETEGAFEFIERFKDETVISLGHTTANYDLCVQAIDAGAKCLTHTFNAMNPIHHREPGPIPAAMVKKAYGQLICDGYHIHPAVVMLAWRMFGSDRLVFISDSMEATGMADGVYNLGDYNVTVKNGKATLDDGTLAGSSITLLECVRRAVEFGIPIEEAVKCASLTPARMMGVDGQIGSIEVGKKAHLVICDKKFNVARVIK